VQLLSDFLRSHWDHLFPFSRLALERVSIGKNSATLPPWSPVARPRFWHAARRGNDQKVKRAPTVGAKLLLEL